MTDRFIHFSKRTPKPEELERILGNYFSTAGQIEKDGDRWLVTLPGRPSSTFAGVEGAYASEPVHEDRWIEVIHHKSLDILTRQQDDFTCALADGLAQALARFYQGRLEDD